MFDIKDLEANFETYLKAWKSRGAGHEELASGLPEKLQKRRELIQTHEGLLAQRNEASQMIAQKKKAGEDASEAIEKQRSLGGEIKKADAEAKQVQEELNSILSHLPNLPDESVPVGASEEDNQEVHKYGELKSFSFEPLPHEELGEKRGWFDFEKSAEITGARFSVLKDKAARLERALIQFMLDRHTTKHGYTEVIPPYIVNRSTLFGTGNLPKFEEDLFKLQGEHDYFLIPTAEVPVTNLHRGDSLKREDLPKYYTAFTPCFRSEAGSYGKDIKGLIRQHQFHKVELVKLCTPESSFEELEKMRKDAESILEALELPYRTVILCSGDMGFSATKTYDLEVWLPSQKKYREISSVSNCLDFQARRMNTRFRDEDGKLKFVHTLNGSGLAVGRTLIAVLENYQQEDQTVVVPDALKAYMNGAEVL